MGLLETVASAVGDVAGGFLNERFAQKNQHQAQDFSEKMYRNRYQYEVEDLKNAGLNPMMAYQQGPGGSPSSSAASAHESQLGSKTVGSYNDTRIATAQEANITAQTAKVEQDRLIGKAQEENIRIDTLGKAKVPEWYAAQITKDLASAYQADATTNKIRAEIPEVESRIRQLESQTKNNKADTKLKETLVQAQEYLNALRQAEKFLTDARIRNTTLEGDIMKPKAKASAYHSAEIGHVAENIGKVGSAAWKFMFPTLSGGQ